MLLRRKADRRWLLDTHLKGVADVPRFAVAVLIGNEDYPKRIVLYPRDDFRAEPAVYEPDAAGVYTRIRRTE